MRRLAALLAGLLAVQGVSAAAAQDRFLTLASTPATQSSGLFEHLLPRFAERTGIAVRVVAVGTGQALRLARSGDVDVLLLHDKPAEQTLVAEGHGRERLDVMYNDFVLVGPVADPAAVRRAETAAAAFAGIAAVKAIFASPGDGSGTHRKELALWAAARVDVAAASGGWYRDTGLGIGAALNAANDLPAYSLADRASWLAFGNRANLALLFDRDPVLFNQYGVVLVDPGRHPHVKAVESRTFAVWLTSDEGQAAIADFRRDGQQVFFPNARQPAE